MQHRHDCDRRVALHLLKIDSSSRASMPVLPSFRYFKCSFLLMYSALPLQGSTGRSRAAVHTDSPLLILRVTLNELYTGIIRYIARGSR